MKTCRRCEKTKPLSDFVVERRNRDGRGSCCRPCDTARTNAWAKRNPEKRRQMEKRWREENPEAARAISQRARANQDPVKRYAQHRTYVEANRERIAEYQRHYKKARPYDAEKQREYKQRHRERASIPLT